MSSDFVNPKLTDRKPSRHMPAKVVCSNKTLFLPRYISGLLISVHKYCSCHACDYFLNNIFINFILSDHQKINSKTVCRICEIIHVKEDCIKLSRVENFE